MRWRRHLKTTRHIFQREQRGDCRHKLPVRTQSSLIPGTHMHPLAAPPQNENAAGVFLEKLYLASLGTETVRSFERAWEGEEYVKKELYTKAEPETHDSGMNIKGEMKTRMQSDLELTKRCGK